MAKLSKNRNFGSLEADFVIVGAGSAGCVLAARLSEDGQNSVLLLEHGGSDASPLIQMPAALSYPMNMRRYDWGFHTDPEPNLAGRQLACPRGKVLGGSSSINGMVYVRGHALDFDHWAECGATGWSYAEVMPYFKRMESSHGSRSCWRGSEGPLHITRGSLENSLFQAFIEAGTQAGFQSTQDYNGEQQEGFGPLEQTIWRGRRWSAARAYLEPALPRPGLRVLRCLARRVHIERRRATGVEVLLNGRIETVRARREVILSASSINSPRLLMHSGIGPAEPLRRLGIPVVADRAGVGQNLQDHLEVYVQQLCRQPITLFSKLNPLAKALIGARWLLFKDGPGASNHFESAAFVRSRAGVRYPDIQFHFLPVAIRYDGSAPVASHGFQVHVGPVRSNSRGRIELRSPDPDEPPSIRFNYLSHPDDWTKFRHCIRLSRELFAQPAFAPYAAGEIAPGAQVCSDPGLDEFIQQTVESAYHPCGSCRMGQSNDPLAVVDPQCRVIGVDALRVVDSSIFPRITNGNLNAPTIMTAEKAADHILERPPLAPILYTPWLHPNWMETDR